MSKGAYIGVGNSAKKIKNIYIGVNGVAKKVKKAYIGVNNVAKLWWSSEYSKLVAETTNLYASRLTTSYTAETVNYMAFTTYGSKTSDYEDSYTQLMYIDNNYIIGELNDLEWTSNGYVSHVVSSIGASVIYGRAPYRGSDPVFNIYNADRVRGLVTNTDLFGTGSGIIGSTHDLPGCCICAYNDAKLSCGRLVKILSNYEHQTISFFNAGLYSMTITGMCQLGDKIIFSTPDSSYIRWFTPDLVYGGYVDILPSTERTFGPNNGGTTILYGWYSGYCNFVGMDSNLTLHTLGDSYSTQLYCDGSAAYRGYTCIVTDTNLISKWNKNFVRSEVATINGSGTFIVHRDKLYQFSTNGGAYGDKSDVKIVENEFT